MKTTMNYFFAATLLLSLAACGNSNSQYDAMGTFEATEVIVSSEGNGKLMRFDVIEGQPLKYGQEVGYIDTVQLYLTKVRLQESNRAVLSNLPDVKKQIAALREEIEKQRTEKARFEALVAGNAANQKQVDDIDSRLKVLEKQLDAQLSTLQNNTRSISGESAAILAQIEQLDDQLNKCRIVSPLRGTVLTKYAEQGELATQGRALFKIADMSTIFLRAYITSDQLSAIKLGQQLTLFSDYGNDNLKEYKGTVTWISDKAEFTPKSILTKNERANLVYAVKIAVKNDGYLKIGMYGQVKL